MSAGKESTFLGRRAGIYGSCSQMHMSKVFGRGHIAAVILHLPLNPIPTMAGARVDYSQAENSG